MERTLYVWLEGETNKASGSVFGTKVMQLHNYHAESWSKKSSLPDSKDWFDKFKADEAAQMACSNSLFMCKFKQNLLHD